MVMNEGPARLRIVVGADDAGVDYKDALAERLRADPRVSEVVDVGIRKGEHNPLPRCGDSRGHSHRQRRGRPGPTDLRNGTRDGHRGKQDAWGSCRHCSRP